MNKRLWIVGWGVLFLLPLNFAHAGRTDITIGTGSVTGIYYPTGGHLCGLLNKNTQKHGIRCNVEATAGSVHNVNALSTGEIAFGIVQSDVAFHAWRGEEPFPTKLETLRSVFALYSESVTLVARKDAGIAFLSDLKGKRVNLGNPGSGQRRTALELFEACNLKEGDLSLAGTLQAGDLPAALREGKLDAYFLVVGHPVPNIQEIAATTNIDLVPLEGACIERLLAAHPSYVRNIIRAGSYSGVDKDVSTFAVRALVLTTQKTSAATVYELVRGVFERLEEFKMVHPSYQPLTAKMMIGGLPLPLHPGAEKYYKEKNLLP